VSDELDTSDGVVPPQKRLPRIGRRLAIGAALVTGLVVLAATLYFLGGMWTRTPQMRSAYDALVTSGQARPIEARFVVPIPGCVCHSDDPVLQAEHSVRRVSECSECH